MKTSALILTAAIAHHASPLFAQAELRDAMTQLDEHVIDTTFEIPLEVLSERFPFKNFRYPFVDQHGRAMFIGNDWFKFTTAKHHNGIYESTPDGVLTPLATQDMIVDKDGDPLGSILGLRTDFESIVFHRGDNVGRSLMGLIRGGPLRELVGTQTIAPGANVPFKSFLYADIQRNWMIFNGTTNTKPWIHGLYHLDVDTGKLIRLIQNDHYVPALGFTPGNFSWQPDLDTDWLVFGAHQLDEKAEVCLPARGILGWRIDVEAGNPEEQFSIDRMELLAPFGMEIPESGGLVLHWANNPVTDGDLVAVAGGYDPEDHLSKQPAYQAILIRTPNGVWHNPIDTNTIIPGHPDGAVFESFNQWIALTDGKLVFIGKGPVGYEAIYIYDTKDAGLYFVIDTNRPIAGRKPIGLETSSAPLVGQRLSFMARFDDGTSGIFRATLPGLKVKPVRTAEDAN
jgi:hypothetical protein